MKTITGNEVRQPYCFSGKRVNSIEEACAAIPFYVETEPAARLSTGKAIPNTQNLYRSDNGYCLGQHTPQFTFLQPCDSLQTLEAARELIGGKWASVSANKGGKHLLAFITLEAEITAPKRGDKVGFSIGFSDFYNGSGVCSLDLFANVLACDNGMVSQKSIVSFSGKHSPNLAERVNTMKKQLHTNLLLEIGRTQEIVFTLDNRPMSLPEMRAFTEQLFPVNGEKVSTRLENIRETVYAGFTRGTGNRGQTRYDALNAVTEYLDWQSTFRETEFSREENRMDSLINGSGAKTRARALDLLLA